MRENGMKLDDDLRKKLTITNGIKSNRKNKRANLVSGEHRHVHKRDIKTQVTLTTIMEEKKKARQKKIICR